MSGSGIDVNVDHYKYRVHDDSHYSSSWQRSFSSRISRILCPDPPPPPATLPPGDASKVLCPSDLIAAGLPPPPPPKPSVFGCPILPPPIPPGCDPVPPPPKLVIGEVRALSYAPKSMALLSIFGSAWILYEILVKDRKKLRSIYHKIIALMSTVDILSSVWLFIGHWAIPPLNFAGVPMFGSGSAGSCTAQGFFFQLGMATPLYNVSLSMYSLLLIRFRWRDARVQQSRTITWLLLFAPLLFGLATATNGLVLRLYNFSPTTVTCNISPLPPAPCDVTSEECLNNRKGLPLRARGWVFGIFTLLPLWSTMFLTVLSSILIVQGVRAQERAANRWTFASTSKRQSQASSTRRSPGQTSSTSHATLERESRWKSLYLFKTKDKIQKKNIDNSTNVPDSTNQSDTHNQSFRSATTGAWSTSRRTETTRNKNSTITSSGRMASASSPRAVRQKKNQKCPAYPKSRKVTMQSICFVGAFAMTWMFYMILNTILLARAPKIFRSFPLELLAAFLLPGQGFFNFLVFIRPRYVQYRERHPEWSIPKRLYRVLQVTFFGRTNAKQSKSMDGKAGGCSAPVANLLHTSPPVTNTLVKQTAPAGAVAVPPNKSNTMINLIAKSGVEEDDDNEVGKPAGHCTNEMSSSLPMQMTDGGSTDSFERNALTEQDNELEHQDHNLYPEGKREDGVEQHNISYGDRETPDNHAMDLAIQDVETGVLPTVTDAEHEDWLYQDLAEEEFSILFCVEESDPNN